MCECDERLAKELMIALQEADNTTTRKSAEITYQELYNLLALALLRSRKS